MDGWKREIEECRGERMSRVQMNLDSGEGTVTYFIF
jgi:hypothetical protein